MKKDLLVVGLLVIVAGLGVGVIIWWQVMQPEELSTKTIKPKSEPIVKLTKKEEPKKTIEPEPKEPIRVALNPPTKAAEKKDEPAPKQIDDKKTPANVEPEPKKKEDVAPPEKKIEVKIEPKVEVKVEPKKQPGVKIIAIGNDIKLNDPDGEYPLKPNHRGERIVLQGRIKMLKIAELSNKSVVDATLLVADEIIITGNLNSGAQVLLGQARSLRYRDVNGKSLLDASALGAKEIHQTGNLNSGSTVKLHAPGGSVEIAGQVNGGTQLDIVAPAGKVLFKTNGAAINSDATLTILARDVELRGDVNGAKTQLDITLTKGGSLKFHRLGGGVRLHYHKADASDPEPRVESGEINSRAEFRQLAAGRK